MALPEQGSVESFRLIDQVTGKISRLYHTVAQGRELPPSVQTVIRDETTGRIFGSFVDRGPKRTYSKHPAIIISGPTVLKDGLSLTDVATSLTTNNPGIPLVCDRALLGELGSVVEVQENHYQLSPQAGGTLDVFTPPLPKPDHSLTGVLNRKARLYYPESFKGEENQK